MALGTLAMGVAWIGCISAESGFCTHFCKLLLAVVQFALVVWLIVAMVALNSISYNKEEVEKLVNSESFEEEWKNLSTVQDSPLCFLQLLFKCSGWEDGDCSEACEEKECEARCPDCSTRFDLNVTQSCKSALLDLDEDPDFSLSGTTALASLLAVFLSLDLVLVCLIMPCFSRKEEGHYVLHARQGGSVPRYRSRSN